MTDARVSRVLVVGGGIFRTVGVLDELMARGIPFDMLRLKNAADGSLIAELPTPRTGGDDLPPTMGALRSDLSGLLARAVVAAGVDVRLGTTVTEIADLGAAVIATLSDGTTETVDLLVGADGIRSQVRGMLGIEHPHGKLLKERSDGYGGIWGEIREGLADDAVVNYQWIETVLVGEPWYRGRSIVIGDAAHACPPLIAQGPPCAPRTPWCSRRCSPAATPSSRCCPPSWPGASLG